MKFVEVFFFCFVSKYFRAEFAFEFRRVEFHTSQLSDRPLLESCTTLQTMFFIIKQRLTTGFAVEKLTCTTLNRIFSYSTARFAYEKVTAGSIYGLLWKDVKFFISLPLKFTVELHHYSIFFRYFLYEFINARLYSFVIGIFLVEFPNDFKVSKV